MKPPIRNPGPVLELDRISRFEDELGQKLPADYRSFLLHQNGGIPRPGWFRLPDLEEWSSLRRSDGNLRWLGQKYGNEAIRASRRDWHRIVRFLGVNSGDEPESPDLPIALRDRLADRWIPIAEVEGFRLNGWLCLDVDAEGPDYGKVGYWPDIDHSLAAITPVEVATSFDALLDQLTDPSDGLNPEWLPLVQDDDLDGLRRWLDDHPNQIRSLDPWGWTSLDHAVFEGRWEIVAHLFIRRDVTPGMILYDSLVEGRFSTAGGMLRFEIQPESIEPTLARKPGEFWADPKMVQAFLDAGANPNFVDEDDSSGNPPLHDASKAGASEAVRLLLARGADPDSENEQGETARDLAFRAGHRLILEILDAALADQPPRAPFENESEAVDLQGVLMIGSSGGLDESSMMGLETRLKVRLPGEYREFLKRFHGGKPRPARFQYRDSDEESTVKCQVTRFLTVSDEVRFGDSDDLESTRHKMLEWGLSRRMLPIASVDDDRSGGLLCLVLRGEDRGRLAYYPSRDEVDSTSYPIAKSLSHFFAKLSQAKDKTPAWVRAIEDDDPEALESWIASGGSLKKRTVGRSLFELAVEGGSVKVVRWLLERGIPAGAAFDLAIEADQPEILLEILNQGLVPIPVPASLLNRFQNSPAIWRSLVLVERLIDLGADVNHSQDSGQTPLMIAAQHGHPEVVRLLLRAGARVGVWNQQGEMALHRAVCSVSRSEMLEKMRRLIDEGEDLHARAPHSALPDQVLKTASDLQTPIADLLKAGGPPASILKLLVESLGQNPENLLAMATSSPVINNYLEHYQQTAAELLVGLRNDPEALAELESHRTRSGPDQ